MLKTILKMMRPVNIVIAAITLIVGYFLLGELPGSVNGISVTAIVLQVFAFALAIGFANIQNDILDLESDKLNRPERPLPSGKLSVTAAKRTWIGMLVACILCGIADAVILHFNVTPAIFFVLLAGLLIAYNIKLKHIPLLKNMTVAFLCATPLLLNLFYPTDTRESDYETMELATKFGLLYPAMLFAFLLTTAREIYKDLEDELGDLKAGIMTFPLIAGTETARRFAGALIIFTWILLPLPVMQGYYPASFLVGTATVFTPCFTYVIVQAHRKNYRKSQTVTKFAMLAGIIALVASMAIG